MNFIKLIVFTVAITFLTQVSSLGLGLGNGYYAVLFLSFIILIILSKGFVTNFLMVWLVFAGLISITGNIIPEFFQPYQRFVAFLLVIGLIGPLMQSAILADFRIRLFKLIKIFLVLFVISSFVGIAIGLPGMLGRGGFSGLFSHSMILGPMAGISTLIILNWISVTNVKNKTNLLIALAILSFITCIASGSRAAILATIGGAFFHIYRINKGEFTRFTRIVLIIICIAVISFPWWEPFTERVMSKMTDVNNQENLLATREALWETRLTEFNNSPLNGVGFSAVDTSLTDKYFNEMEGQIEPGSSWLVVLSMTGILGFLPLFLLSVRYLLFVNKDSISIERAAHLGSLLIFFLIHLTAEGYVLAAGSGLFFLFWLLLGILEIERKGYSLNAQ